MPKHVKNKKIIRICESYIIIIIIIIVIVNIAWL